MPQGVPTSPDTVARFRAHYLYSGNAAESAREVQLPESTGRDLARELAQDKEFVATRRKLRDQYLDELVAARMRVAQKALERFEGELEAPTVAADAMITIIDKRADYGKLVIDAEKNAHGLAKLDAEKSGEIKTPSEVRVIVTTTREDLTGDENGDG